MIVQPPEFGIYQQVNLLNEQLEFFIKNYDAKDSGSVKTLVETLALVETAKTHKPPCADICSQMRATALKTRRFSPNLTAHLELLANHYEPKH